MNAASQTSETPVVTVPLLDLKAQYATIRTEIREAVDRVLDSQNFILGGEVEGLEREIAAYSGCGFGIGVSSGTDALLVTLMALKVGPGDEVITTPYTFFSTAGCVARLGAKTVFVDIEPETFNIDVTKLEAAITPNTKAIIPVHLYGQMADMDPIMEIANRHGIPVIEDAAQAIGAEYKGRRAGAIAQYGYFSFFPSKNLGGFGDGGMVTTDTAERADDIKLYRNHGYRPKYYNRVVGGNFRLDALQAAVLRVKLNYLESWTAGRRSNADAYRSLLAERGLTVATIAELTDRPRGIFLPVEAEGNRHIYNQFVIRTGQRNELQAFLKGRNIGTEIYYPVSLHLQDCFTDLGYKRGDFPVSEQAADQSLALPIFTEISDEQRMAVVDAIAAFAAGA